MTRSCVCIAIDNAADEQVLGCLLIDDALCRREQRRCKPDREPAAGIPVFPPLLGVVAVTAEAEEIKLKSVGERVVVEYVEETCAKPMRRAIVAFSDLLDDAPRDVQRVLELLFILLILMAKTLQFFVC
jgi:hypothetical protein